MIRAGGPTRAAGRRGGRPAILLAGTAVALLLLLGAGPVTLGRPGPSAGLGLTVTASPLTGPAPLTVQFRASTNPSSESVSFNWSFGDGTYLQVVEPGGSTPEHSYGTPGVYDVNVSANSSLGTAAETLQVSVGSPAISVSFLASPQSGPAPLTVDFSADLLTASAGWRSILWTFGDGGSGSGSAVTYTYERAGTFVATLNATDLSGRSRNATVEIVVSPGPSGAADGPILSPTVVWEVSGVLAAAAILAVAYRSLVGRRTVLAPPQTAPTALSEVGAATIATPPPVPTPEELEGPPPQDSSPDASRRLSERLLVHLYWFGRPDTEGTVRFEATQQGMAQRLGTTQNGVSKALQRLVAAEFVTVSQEHVPGYPRRVKAYRLTPRGEGAARSIRREWGAK